MQYRKDVSHILLLVLSARWSRWEHEGLVKEKTSEGRRVHTMASFHDHLQTLSSNSFAEADVPPTKRFVTKVIATDQLTIDFHRYRNMFQTSLA